MASDQHHVWWRPARLQQTVPYILQSSPSLASAGFFDPSSQQASTAQRPIFLLHSMPRSLNCVPLLPFRYQPEHGHLPAAISVGGYFGVPPSAERLHTSSAGAGWQCDHNTGRPHRHTCHPHVQPTRAQCEWGCSNQVARDNTTPKACTESPLAGVRSNPWVLAATLHCHPAALQLPLVRFHAV